ncbi:MAG: YbbR-like domain-containing protein [Desulfobulbaceae bacterium]|jgi:hypothetical protein|nr:YbbR-like domain-containing protein [Desulfobulbaceae bacterium]
MPSKTPDYTLPFQHWPLKLLALLIGVTLWYGIVAEDQVDIVMTVPLELRNLPATMIIANQYKKDMEVSVRGPKRLLQELQQQNISRPVNLAVASPGPVVIQNTPESIPFPRGVTVQRVQPANITLLVDQLIEKNIPLVAKTTGDPAPGFSLEGIRLKPGLIKASGPLSLLGKVQSINTSTIDVEGLTQTSTVQAQLLLDEALLQVIGETVVEAEILIKEPMTRRTVHYIPINLKQAEKTGRVEPAMVSVEADIPAKVVRETPELSMLFRASVNFSEKDNEGYAPIRVEAISLPNHTAINIITVRPEQARLTTVH